MIESFSEEYENKMRANVAADKMNQDNVKTIIAFINDCERVG